jgi:hypothetical protein
MEHLAAFAFGLFFSRLFCQSSAQKQKSLPSSRAHAPNEVFIQTFVVKKMAHCS